ncbi:MAG TPA: glycosyltransferase [Intrasporangium sp.]|uniref:glycosyltransferase family 2 protein n=1 Tax=Intrasporangium sp. TaxID=1925024 RepID=UPI002B490C93|nr:glycosyltransferase [Intrasporangium sp.]HKX68706.1 glycosyltransferase [Intrasporangium sp.]
MTDRLVSIVIPCFNDEPEHLISSVRSAQNQTHPHTEVVVVNDGSTRTETIAALRQLEGAKVLHQDNRGPGAALNLGIEAASGQYILPLGADDTLDDRLVELTYRRLVCEGPQVMGVYPRVEFFGLREGTMNAPPSVDFRELAVRNKVVATTLYRKSDWMRAGGYGSFDDCSEDWYFWLILTGRLGGRLVQEPEAVFHYRIRPSSRNLINRGVDRKEACRRHAAAALPPDRVMELYLAAAREADEAIADADRYGSYVASWRHRLRYLLPAYKGARDLKRRLMA